MICDCLCLTFITQLKSFVSRIQNSEVSYFAVFLCAFATLRERCCAERVISRRRRELAKTRKAKLRHEREFRKIVESSASRYNPNQ